MNILALIPARGGSKGIPKKNITPFCGRPLIAQTIETARNAGVFNRIVVSTDDAKIAEVANECGAEVPFMRPSKLAGDEIKDFPVFQRALRWLIDHQDWHTDIVVGLRPTNPLRTVDDIKLGLEKFASGDFESLRSACIAEHHPYRMVRIKDNVAQPLLPEEAPIIPYRRQELPDIYRWNGLVDIMWARNFLTDNTMFGNRIGVLITPRNRSIDIDDPFDLVQAEAAFKSALEGF